MSAPAGYVAPMRVSTLVVGDLDYDREDRGCVVRVKRRRRSAVAAPSPTRRAVVLAARDALVLELALELAQRTGLPLRDVREALRDGRDAAEIGAWSPVTSREARVRRMGRS